MENERPTSEPAPRPRARTSFKIVLVLVAVLFGLVAVEGAVRVRHFLKTGSFAAVYRFEVDAATGLRLPEPGTNGHVTVNDRGFRGPDIADPKPADTLRIGFAERRQGEKRRRRQVGVRDSRLRI